MTALTQADVGKAITFYDTRGQACPALITAVHGSQCVNLIYVNDVEGQRDNYGQKMLRACSVMHGSWQQAHGYYWLYNTEERKPVWVNDSAE